MQYRAAGMYIACNPSDNYRQEYQTSNGNGNLCKLGKSTKIRIHLRTVLVMCCRILAPGLLDAGLLSSSFLSVMMMDGRVIVNLLVDDPHDFCTLTVAGRPPLFLEFISIHKIAMTRAFEGCSNW